jgi:hypothetical protein
MRASDFLPGPALNILNAGNEVFEVKMIRREILKIETIQIHPAVVLHLRGIRSDPNVNRGTA